MIPSLRSQDVKMNKNEVTELIKAIRHRCDIYLILADMENTGHLLPTVLEDMHEDSQAIIGEYCVEEG